MDPYVYPGTDVLKNKFDLRTESQLVQVEYLITDLRTKAGLPKVSLNYDGFRALHRHLFQDIYAWAGEERTVDMQKGSSVFCRSSYISENMNTRFCVLKNENSLKGLSREDFAERAAEHISEINAVHPFREGNGRTQMLFLARLGQEAGYYINLEKLAERKERWLEASIAGMATDYSKMRELLLDITEPLVRSPEKQQARSSEKAAIATKKRRRDTEKDHDLSR
ncbi:MAG: Fic family protein [Bdellovibrionales bacterium]|nr:Fic family protein [Bdellovibrionales bacterium]